VSAELSVGCILVHHRHFPAVLGTVEALQRCGVASDRIILIDNSEDPDIGRALRSAVPRGVEVIGTDNRGYGNAVNVGIRAWQTRQERADLLLVSTHEAFPSEESLRSMVRAVKLHPNAAVCGPVLFDSSSKDTVWSMGGGLRRISGMPFHIRPARAGSRGRGSVFSREWLDGAFCLYRTAVLQDLLFREDFVMYFEEVDLHQRIRAAGWDVLCVEDASVGQTSSGIPPYFLARNLQMFVSAHGRRWQKVLGAPYASVRFMIRMFGRPGRVARASDLVTGWRDGLHHVACAPGEPWPQARRALAHVEPGGSR